MLLKNDHVEKKCEKESKVSIDYFFKGGGMLVSWQVIEYMEDNPGASVRDIIGFFAEELEVDKHIQSVKVQVEKVQEIRHMRRPLYTEKVKKKELMQEIEMETDMEVMVRYPKGKGTDKDRKAYKVLLLQEHVHYGDLKKELEAIENDLTKLDEDLYDVEQAARNGRKILDVFDTYMEFIKHSTKEISAVEPANKNSNLF